MQRNPLFQSLFDEYDRQVKLLALEDAELERIMAADRKRHAAADRQFAEMCRRALAQQRRLRT